MVEERKVITADKVVDNLTTISSEKPLSASQGKVLKDLLDAKQNILTFDESPTSGSNNPVKSKGIYTALEGREPKIETKGTAFNKDFGTTIGTVCQGNDSRLSDSRTPTAHADTHKKGSTDELALDSTQITTGTLSADRLPKATSTSVGAVRPDGSTITIDTDGKITAVGTGGTAWGGITGTLSNQTDLQTALNGKVNTEVGKGLTTNDFTTVLKGKLDDIEDYAEVNVISKISVNGTELIPVSKAVEIAVPTKTSQITNDSGYQTASGVDSKISTHNTSSSSHSDIRTSIDTKQDTLVSGSNIKTINSQSILGSGNINVGAAWGGITGTLSNQTDLKNELDDKVTKIAGMGLSTNDYSDVEKNKLDGIEDNAQRNAIETIKVNGTEQTITARAVDITVPTKTSQLTNDSGYQTSTEVGTLISTHNSSNTAHSDIRTAIGTKQDTITTTSKLSSDLVSDTDKTNKFVTETEKTTWNSKQAQHLTGTNTLTSSGWDSTTKQQQISITGVTATNTVIVSPSGANYLEYNTAQIRCISQVAGALTFQCETVPTSDIVVDVVILS